MTQVSYLGKLDIYAFNQVQLLVRIILNYHMMQVPIMHNCYFAVLACYFLLLDGFNQLIKLIPLSTLTLSSVLRLINMKQGKNPEPRFDPGATGSEGRTPSIVLCAPPSTPSCLGVIDKKSRNLPDVVEFVTETGEFADDDQDRMSRQ